MRVTFDLVDKRAISAMDRKMQSVFSKKVPMFIKTLNPFLLKVERNIIKDTFTEPFFSHDFKGSVKKSITARVSSAYRTNDGFNVEIEAGIFNPHGLNLEEGSPAGTDIPIHRMRQWVKKKFGSDDLEVAKRIKKSIYLQGSLIWPIVRPSWEASKDQYLRLVFDQFRARFK